MKVKFDWKNDFPVSFSGDAQEIGERIALISEKRGGSLVAEDIMTPLHPNFEWDDAKAAHEYRLHTARVLLGAIVAVRIGEQDVQPVRAFVHVKEVKAYMPIEVAFTRLDIARGIVADALREYKSWYKRYKDLEEFGKIIQAIDDEGMLLAA